MAQRVKRLPTMHEPWVQSLGREDLLEKAMVTHSSILAWKIPWNEKSGRLQAMGSQRVGHDSNIKDLISIALGFPGGSEVKASASKAGDLGSILGSGRSPEEGNGNPLQYSCLENPMDRGAWQAIVHGVAKCWTRLSE